MSKGNIITPLTPGENIETNEETPNDIYPPSDSKEAHKLDNQNCCKKCECLEIIFFFFIIIISIITSIIIQFEYHIIPIMTLKYGFCSFIAFFFFFAMKIYQVFGKIDMLLVFLFAGLIWCGFDCLNFVGFKSYKEIKEIN